MADCRSKVKESLQETLSKLYNDQQDVLDAATKAIDERYVDEIASQLEELANNVKNPKTFRTEANKILQANRRVSWLKKLDTLDAKIKAEKFNVHVQQEGFKNPAEGILSIFEGTKKSVDNATNSIENVMSSKSDRYNSYLDQLFTPAEEKHLIKGGIEAQTRVFEILEIGPEKARNNYDLKEIEIAKKVKKFYDYHHIEKTEAGFDVPYLDNYTPRSYDAAKIRSNREGAIELLFQSIDKDKSFPGMNEDQIRKIVEKSINAQLEGDITKGLMNTDMLDITQRSSLEARNTKSRKFIFHKGASAKWNAEFGKHSLFEAMSVESHSAAKRNALREVMGKNPKAMIDSVVKKNLKRLTEAGDLDGAADLKAAYSSGAIDKAWAQLDGRASRPGSRLNILAATALANTKSVIYASLLGRSTITASTDLASMASIASARLGENLGLMQAKVLAEYAVTVPGAIGHAITLKNKSFMKEAARMGVFLETGQGAILRHVGDIGPTSKAIGKLTDLHTRINPIGIQTAHHKMVMTSIMSDGLSRALRANEMGGIVANTLRRSGLTEDFYPALRGIIKEVEGKGILSLDINSVRDLDTKIITDLRLALGKKDPGILGKSDQQIKTMLETQLETMFNDIVNDGVPTPGLKQARQLNQGTAPGTIEGTIMRSIGMLKSFSLKMADLQQTLWHASPDMASKMKNTLGWATSLTAMGYTALALNDLSQNKTPRDFDLLESMMKGGAGGLYVDLILDNATSDYGKGVAAGLAGPVLGPMDTAFDLARKASKGNLKWKDTSKLIKHIPFQNHLIARPIIDALFLESLQNATNPKRARNQRKLMRERGQSKLFD